MTCTLAARRSLTKARFWLRSTRTPNIAICACVACLLHVASTTSCIGKLAAFVRKCLRASCRGRPPISIPSVIVATTPLERQVHNSIATSGSKLQHSLHSMAQHTTLGSSLIYCRISFFCKLPNFRETLTWQSASRHFPACLLSFSAQVASSQHIAHHTGGSTGTTSLNELV